MKTLVKNNGLFSSNESVEFLITEYNQCFEQLRHYDNAQTSLINLTLTGYIAIFTGSFALYQYKSIGQARMIFLIGIFFLSWLIGTIILATFVRNRLYFTLAAKQVNSIRNYFLNNSEINFIDFNKMYLSDDKPHNFSALSSDSMCIYLISLFNASLFGCGVLLATHNILQKPIMESLWWVIISSVIVLICQVGFTIKFFQKKDTQNADTAAWGEPKNYKEGSQC